MLLRRAHATLARARLLVGAALAVAAVNPPSLQELVERALPRFANRQVGNIFSRSVMRAAVIKLDTSQTKRGFRDKEEWKCVLSRLEEAGKLAYLVESDEIQVAATGAGSESDSDAA